jgi:hypothetical protein
LFRNYSVIAENPANVERPGRSSNTDLEEKENPARYNILSLGDHASKTP